MLAIKKRFEDIKDLEEENLSFDDYLHLKEIIKALCRLKTVSCTGVVLVDNKKVVNWFKRNQRNAPWLDISYELGNTYCLSWRHK